MDKVYYTVEMIYDRGFKQYHDCNTLDEALLRVRKGHEMKLPKTDVYTLQHAEIWKMRREKVYEYIKNNGQNEFE